MNPKLDKLQTHPFEKLRDDYKNLIMFSNLSKRSNVSGMRSGFETCIHTLD